MQFHLGDCLEVMRTLPDNSVDSVVTDPPYGLSFMGKKWDYDVPSVEVWAEALRVLKPGGHLLAFAGTRTQHRMACRIEDAGFEIRDMIAWLYGSGFPKSHNGEWGGTALKPAMEPITFARKPLIGTVEANWREHGTGALNIDGCRIGYESQSAKDSAAFHGRSAEAAARGNFGQLRTGAAKSEESNHREGRWPANVIHDGSEEVQASFPHAPWQQGDLSGKESSRPAKNVYGEYKGRREFKARREGEASADRRYTEEGATNFAKLPGMRREATSAARFFYCAKADRADRNDGCEGMDKLMPKAENGAENAVSANRGSLSKPRENFHPTVKPTDLMRYLCRLVTPPGGTVLDPFMGSGSTGRGAIAEGFQFIGIELDPDYARIAEARIRAMQPGLAMFGTAA